MFRVSSIEVRVFEVQAVGDNGLQSRFFTNGPCGLAFRHLKVYASRDSNAFFRVFVLMFNRFRWMEGQGAKGLWDIN